MGALFWAISTAVFAILEVIIPGLVTIWLALAALIVTLCAWFVKNPTIEFLIFSILSLAFVLFTRPVLQKYMEKKNPKFDSRMIGTKINVEKIVDLSKELKEYEVKYKGSIWIGISNEILKIGEEVGIKNFEGNKIVLEKLK